MTNAASNSNPSVTVNVNEAYPNPSHVIAPNNVNEAYPNPSHVIGPNFVTVKLSGKSQYNLWRIEMECLLKSQHMVDFIKGAENGKGKMKVGDMAMEASDSLVKGWILGSLSEEAARKSVNHLIHMKKKPDFTAKDLWDELQRSYGPSVREQAAVLHVAVGSSTKNHELLKKLLELTPTEEYTLLDVVNSDGSTVLHVAAIGGNIEAVNILVEKNPDLLLAKDMEGHTPLVLSISNKGYGNLFSGPSGEELVILAISCQDFRLAHMIIDDYYDAILPGSDAVLTALAQNFPRELHFWEPRGEDLWDWKGEYYRRRYYWSYTAPTMIEET